MTLCQTPDGSRRDEEVVLHAEDRRAVINTGTFHLPPIFIDLQAAARTDLRNQGHGIVVPVTPGVYVGLAPRAPHTASLRQIRDGSRLDDRAAHQVLDVDFG